MQTISLKTLLEAGCHFGHKADRWHPKADRFIYQERDGIHVIDLAKTKTGLEKAAALIEEFAKNGKAVLFLGTKRQAAGIIRTEATRVGAPYIAQRWIGGFLTNWNEVHKNLEKIRRMTEEEKNGSWNKFPKHERVKNSRYLKKLNFFYGGVVQLHTPPDALFVVDIKKESVAVAEATKMGIPVIGVADTNVDPDLVTYAIPSNDDAVGAVTCIVSFLANAYEEGKQAHEKEAAATEKKLKEQAAQAVEKAQAEATKKAAPPVPQEKKVVAQPVTAQKVPAEVKKTVVPATVVPVTQVKPKKVATKKKTSKKTE